MNRAAIAGAIKRSRATYVINPSWTSGGSPPEGTCRDAGMNLSDVDGLIGAGPPGVGLRHGGSPAGLADVLGHPIRFHGQSSVGAAALAAGLNLAVHAISTGLARAVLMVNAVAGRRRGWQR